MSRGEGGVTAGTFRPGMRPSAASRWAGPCGKSRHDLAAPGDCAAGVVGGGGRSRPRWLTKRSMSEDTDDGSARAPGGWPAS